MLSYLSLIFSCPYLEEKVLTVACINSRKCAKNINLFASGRKATAYDEIETTTYLKLSP